MRDYSLQDGLNEIFKKHAITLASQEKISEETFIIKSSQSNKINHSYYNTKRSKDDDLRGSVNLLIINSSEFKSPVRLFKPLLLESQLKPNVYFSPVI